MNQTDVQEDARFFSPAELALLMAVNPASQVTQVNYYQWINRAKPDTIYAFIDKIELRFTDGLSLYLAINEADTGLAVLSAYDFEAEKADVEQEFEGKIALIKFSAGQEDVWTEVLSQPLSGIVLDKQEGGYLNRAILLDYDTQKRIVFMTAEKGLTVDFYED